MTLFLILLHALILATLVGNRRYVRRRPTPASSYPSLSVLIPARNEEDNLKRLLPSLFRQDHPDFEVIVYDDGSEDGTWRVLQEGRETRLRAWRGSGPPPGWVGKVHALYQASRHARGSHYLFLDADAELLHPRALRAMFDAFAMLPPGSVLTSLTRLRGGGRLLVSLIPNAILSGLPWPLVPLLRHRSLGALNGQCWLIAAATYHRHEPHDHVRAEVLEDVEIGRYLLEKGHVPVLRDLQDHVAVHMYRSFSDAWQGLRKNAYLILGGTPPLFAFFFSVLFVAYILPPFVSPWFLVSIYLLKGFTDRMMGFPLWVTLLAPLGYALGTVLQLDSALAHWTGRVSWKGRRIPRTPPPSGPAGMPLGASESHAA